MTAHRPPAGASQPRRAPEDEPRAEGPRADGPPEDGPVEDGQSLRERIAARQWRRRIAARRSLDTAYRAGVGVLGTALLVFGLITIPLPGPGWLTVITALFVLATEFTWAERLLEFTKHHVSNWTEWLGRQRVWVRVAVAVATAAFVYVVLVVTLHLVGVPGWLPGWVPMWR